MLLHIYNSNFRLEETIGKPSHPLNLYHLTWLTETSLLLIGLDNSGACSVIHVVDITGRSAKLV